MRRILATLLPAALAATCAWGQASLKSPDAAIEIAIAANGGPLAYRVSYRGKPVILESPLGLQLEQAPPLGAAVRIAASRTGALDETYSMPHGRSNPVRNHCNTLTLDLEETAAPARKLALEVRAYNDGVAFRYALPAQPGLSEVRLAAEKTAFTLAKDATTYALILESFQTPYEDGYHIMPLSGWHPEWLAGLPLLAEIPGTAWIAITEAQIDNYAGMYLQHNAKDAKVLTARLSPSLRDQGLAVRASAPMQSPWRVIMIADQPGRLVESNIVINLNPPSQIADTSWIKPGKTAWDWWSGSYATGVDFKPGMNTATMNHYIDFASSAGLQYMLIDAGWSFQGAGPNDSGSDLTRTNPDIDLPAILAHAKAKNVGVWLWAHWSDINRQIDQAFPLYEKWGIAGVKIDFMNRDDQWMVNFYHDVLRKAAAHHLMIDFHGAYKPDGIRRTWPNLITREGVMGLEYSKWSARITGDHNVMLAFTRMLAGPMDYTPGGFHNVTREEFEPRMTQPMVMATRAHETALYVVFESGLQMLADYPEAYEGQKELDFLRAVPNVWDETRVVTGRPGLFISVARRRGREWYLGSITGGRPMELDVPLEFLGHGDYIAEIYSDAPDAALHPQHSVKEERWVNATSVLHVRMAPDGGQAVRFRPVE
jgi:alpha-glucosidase